MLDKNMSFCPGSAMSHGGHFGRQMPGMYKQDDDHSCQPTLSFLGRILFSIYRSAGEDNGGGEGPRTAPEMFIEI